MEKGNKSVLSAGLVENAVEAAPGRGVGGTWAPPVQRVSQDGRER